MVNVDLNAPKTLLSCLSCQKQFGRPEHLKRHELSHDTPRFQCSLCSKSFSRKDGLDRHELTHETTSSLVQKKARACLACAAAKVRCSGERPLCQRCSRRSWPCSYPAPDERQLDDSNLQHFDHVQSPEDNYSSTAGPGACFSNIAANLSNHISLAVSSLQPGPNPGLNSGMENYLHDWEDGAYNINWLPLNSVDLDISDSTIHFPFQQITNMNLVQNAGTNIVSPPITNWHPSFPRPPVDTISQGSVEHVPRQTVSASPASIINHRDESVVPSSPAQTTTSGEFYIDGNGARLPRVKRRRLTSVSHSKSTASPGLSLTWPQTLTMRNPSITLIEIHQYSQISDLYQRLCLMSNFFRPFTESELLPREALSNLLHTFITNIHPLLPFTHIPTLDVSKLDSALIVAMAALGARHLETDEGEALSSALLEFLRRIFLSNLESRDTAVSAAESLVKAQLCYVVGAKFSGVPSLEKSADEVLKQIARDCVTTANPEVESFTAISNDAQWRSWAKSEEQRRVRFSIWLVDGIIATEDRIAPILGLSAISHLPLPCHETIWSAGSVASLLEAIPRFQSPPDVSSVVQELYITKKLAPDLGEFAQLLLVYSVIKQTWEMRLYLQHDLAGFEPTAEKLSLPSNEIEYENRRRSSDIYQRWKNAACDCLDILHWRANAMIGAASGMEHPGVMYLHFARVILLAPMQEIIELATHLSRINAANASGNGITLQARQQPIRQWVVEDQYKARLAAIHAGVLFWHIRRYSASAFYEPGAVAHSTLMLWALSAFSSSHRNENNQEQTDRHLQQQQRSIDITEPPIDRCDIILIDRPTDDVLVQQFVRQGQNMQAIMAGVGNLFGPLGPQRVLREGHSIISSLDSCRHHGQYWLNLLKTLDLATSPSSQTENR